MRGNLESIASWISHRTRNVRTWALAMLVLAVIDTAATYAMIDGATASAAGVSPPAELSVNVLGLDGLQLFPVVYVSSLSAGNTHIGAFPAALSRRIAVDGVHNVLPLAALEGDVVDFDFDEGRVLIYNGRPDRSTRLLSSRLKMHFRQGLWFAEVKLNGVKGLALVDTGSSISYVNSQFAEAAGAKPNDEKTKTIRGITGGNVAIRVATARKFTLGQHRVTGPDLIVSDPAWMTNPQWFSVSTISRFSGSSSTAAGAILSWVLPDRAVTWAARS